MKQQTSNSERFARLKVPGYDRLLTIPVSYNKPEIPTEIKSKWQKMIDLTAEIMGVASGLVTHFTNDELQVFVASAAEKNPYKPSDSDQLGIGMFCEYVVGRKQSLLVEDTEASPIWKDHPHTAFGMRSYLGVPIEWEDGELFGSLCVLDGQPNSFSSSYLKLMEQFKSLIETDLKTILLINDLQQKVTYNEIRLRDIHHRLKNQFNILTSYIGLQMMDDQSKPMEEVLKDINHRITLMSTIHEEICRSTDLETPTLDVYIPLLCEAQLHTYPDKMATMSYSLESLRFPLQNTISLGLIIAELVSNSIKHGFKSTDDNHIHITAKKDDDSTIYITFRDNGTGLPDFFDHTKTESIGMSLLRAFSEQLRGKLRVYNDGGAVVELAIPAK